MGSSPTNTGRTPHGLGLRGRLAGLFSSPSPCHHQHSDEVVAKLKEEVEKQRDLKETYMARLESTQAYLRFCLEVAQVHGFLHLVSNSNGGDDEPHRDAGDQEPATAAAAADDDEDAAEAPPCDPYFAATRDLAVQHGWSVAPDEVRSRETFVHRSQQSLISCPWTQIELHEMIGRGSTADVYRATWRGLDVAVKWMRAEFFAAADQRSRGEAFFAQELDALSRQRHPHVLRLMAACLRPPASCFLVTELLTGATLAQWLHGTYVYMAPEIIRCEPYTEKCDVYSFGIILNELVTGEHPYIDTGYGPSKIALEVSDGKLRPKLAERDVNSSVLNDLICGMWDAEPSKRPSFATITSALRKIKQQLM
ncbi:serine/threonine/tyrosine-protein kinase HT1-like [Oryza glaberrima]|uniref:serine/threonine/tyrosine-protein kinase HT1-like n=1 Tax=Oryza glaberrima TaxID=4538 RepID=UPI00224C3D1D|nr:serine/threonine/tyrosine-protein kinase HT1-like [Oryza glaberrima]